jgi:hypothetical protein
VLVDENNSDVLSLFGELRKGGFDRRSLRLVVDDQEVLLRIGAGRDMLLAG